MDIWSYPKRPWRHFLYAKRLLKYKKMNIRTMDKLLPRFLVVTLKYGCQPHDDTDRIKPLPLKLFTNTVNRKPIIRSIITWEQLLIDFRVILLNFITRKNKNQHEIQDSSWIIRKIIAIPFEQVSVFVFCNESNVSMSMDVLGKEQISRALQRGPNASVDILDRTKWQRYISFLLFSTQHRLLPFPETFFLHPVW